MSDCLLQKDLWEKKIFIPPDFTVGLIKIILLYVETVVCSYNPTVIIRP